MATKETFQRLLAALVGLGWSSKALYRTLHDPDPRAQQPAVILFRAGICALVLFIFLKRAAGKRMEATTWSGLACFFVVGIWNATTVLQFVISTAVVVAAFIGGELERQLGRAAQLTP
jgi:hypothetical protein